MLAGALKDNGRAALIGEKTFGKGVVQQVWEFDNGTSVKITSARFFRPSGLPIQGVGLAPDVRVNVSRASDTQLQRAIQLAFNNASKHIALRIAPLQEKRPQHEILRSTSANSALGQSASGSR
jgi:C-terminal processing protease CtpA/Prc